MKGVQIVNKNQVPNFTFLIYGDVGMGKTTLAGEFEKPIFLGTEKPKHIFGVATFEESKTLDDLKANLDLVRDEKHEYKTLVLDTLGGLEKLIAQEYLGGETILSYSGGFGKGDMLIQNVVAEMMINFFKPIFERGMNIIFIAHERARGIKDLSVGEEGYDQIQPDLVGKYTASEFFAYVECILRISKEREGKRKITTVGDKYILAKNRFGFKNDVSYIKGKMGKLYTQKIKDFYLTEGGNDESRPKDGGA